MTQQLIECAPMIVVLVGGGLLVAFCRWVMKGQAADLAAQSVEPVKK